MAKLIDLINSSEVRGEKGTGYENPNGLGEFECENCKFFDTRDGTCGQRDMMRLSKQPRMKDGRVKVNPEGCCEYVWRIGRKDEDDDAD